uniref:4a-hydroxytetrahydrobiopterin dehydratase n=1 Tax=Wollemia nobilis TaxID=56998 RepID=A0A0C9S3W0_9CONI
MATQVLCSSCNWQMKKLPLRPTVYKASRSRNLSLKNKNKGTLKWGARAILGDFGARDPFPAELESKFGEKVVGDFGTDHKILIPSVAALSLADRPCDPNPPGLSHEEATALLRKVVGWRIVEGDRGPRLECLWKVKSFSAGMELFRRIAPVAEAANHHPDLHLEGGNSVRAQIWTHSIGGLSINDFIVAAKIDRIKISDLIPRKRVWA